MIASRGPDGPRSKRRALIGSPSARDVYWIFGFPAFCVGFAIWITYHWSHGDCPGPVLLWPRLPSHVGRERSAAVPSVDRSRGSIPGSQVSIQAGSVGPGGTVSISASHTALAVMVILAVVTTPLAVPLISGTRRARTKAWTEWDRSHATVYE